MTKIPYLGLALDPIHVGTGEFQLGRVDNTIVREPATGIPKIPGSSIAGVARAYAAMRTPRFDGAGPDSYLYQREGQTVSCAGKGGPNGDEHCGSGKCAVCVAFGFSRGGGKSSFQGLASFYDARILLFPVASTTGAAWVTTPRVLEEAGFANESTRTRWEGRLGNTDKSVAWKAGASGSLRLGWMNVPVWKPEKGEADTFFDKKLQSSLADLKASQMADRIVLVAEDLFGALVNDNLEVRTSVSIDPKTGTASGGALFTAEAIPRTTVFWSLTTIQQTRYFRIGSSAIGVNDETLKSTVKEALADMEMLGVGGLNTRGFGRLRVAPEREEASKHGLE